MDWNLVSFIKRSEQRISIIKCFHSTVTPREIIKRTNLNPSHVSRALKEFSEKGIVRCVNPETKIGRLYQLTSLGEEILKVLQGGELADKLNE